ncbi:MAG: PH domain-containing protein [Rhodospirillales bacterium]|nr:PH domain-containing protein [Rhodospirillales bacterium]
MAAEPSDVRKFRENKLEGGEEIQAFCGGWVGEMLGNGDKSLHNGALILTNKRIAFYCKAFFKEVFEQIPLDRITSVETKSLLGHHQATFHTSHNALVFKCLAGGAQLDPIVKATQNAAGKPGKAETAPESPLDTLKKLSELRDAGLLSEEEFAGKKAELLARI